MDTGAQKSVVGRLQAQAYCKVKGIKLILSPSKTVFRFGDTIYTSLGKLSVLLPTPIGKCIYIDMDVKRSNAYWFGNP
jgi:hypothetical protein